MMEQITQQCSPAERSISRYLMVEGCSQAQSYTAQYGAVTQLDRLVEATKALHSLVR